MSIQRIAWSAAIVLAVIIGLALLPPNIRDRKVEQQARYRLHRLARAVNLYVIDHKQQWPEIQNPSPRKEWQPFRRGSTAEVLSQYLSGDNDLRPQRLDDKKLRGQRDNETYDDYLIRLRNREISACPATGFDYWWDQPGRTGTPDDAITGRSPGNIIPNDKENRKGLRYFSSQLTSEGTAPYTNRSGQPVLYASYGIPVQRTVTHDDVVKMREQLRTIENENQGLPIDEQTHDIALLREKVLAYEQALSQKGSSFTVGALDTVVIEERYP